MIIEEDIKMSVSCMSISGVILYPTDTIWGLGCNAMDANAVRRIYDIKQRPKEKSLIVLLADAKDIFQYVAAPHPDIIDIVQSFDKPTTVIYSDVLGFPDEVVHEDGTVGIRVVDDMFCKSLIKRLGKPLISTSANLSGDSSPSTYRAISDIIKDNVDYIVTHRQDDTIIKPASRIVTINTNGSLNIIRG